MKISIILGILACSLLMSCSDDISDPGELKIRVKNVSPYNFKNVFVNTSGGEHNFGDLDDGHTSDYAVFELAYRYAFIELQIDGETYTLQPIDYVGETPLERGNYTYQVDAQEEGGRFTRLSLELKKE